MDEPRSIPPKRPRQYDLTGMHDEDFEAMVARLVHLEHPGAVKPANSSDGGADMVLAGSKEADGNERCWQVKHYPDAMRWEECKKSLKAAKENWQPRHYTFVFPRELTVKENKTFDKHFGSEDIPVDYWNGDHLQGKLTGSDDGRRVAKTFFSDVEEDKAETNRAIRAGGSLDTPEDALDRLNVVEESLSTRDAYFSYPTASREADMPGPQPTPGTVMSIEKSDGTSSSRVDMVPRDKEAMERYGPRFRLATQDTPEGREAAKTLADALAKGEGFTISEGLELTPTRLPPAFSHLEGKPIEGEVTAVPVERQRARAEPLQATLTARGGGEKAELRMTLSQTDDVPEGWDDCFEGEFGGLQAKLRLRKVGTGGETRWTYKHQRVATGVADQVKALEFMRVLSLGGDLKVVTQNAELPPTPVPKNEFPEYAQALLAFLEDMLVIEKWTGREFELPEGATGGQLRDVATTAQLIRDRGSHITWNSMDMVMPDTAPLRSRRPIMVEQGIEARLLGDVVPLGYVRVTVSDYYEEDRGPAPEGGRSVRIRPLSGENQRVFQHLVKERMEAKKPPPPPPRKSRGRRKKGKGKGR